MEHKEITDALKVGLFHTERAAARARDFAFISANERHMHGTAAIYEQHAADADKAAEFISNVLTKLLKGD